MVNKKGDSTDFYLRVLSFTKQPTKGNAMGGSLNKVQIIGNLGKDPEIRSFQNGGKVANLTIATSESWKDKATGERKEKTEWHRVSILHLPLIDVAEKYLRKGAKVYIEGQLETRKYEDANKVVRYSTEIVLRPFGGQLTMLDAKRGEEVTADIPQASEPNLDADIPF